MLPDLGQHWVKDLKTLGAVGAITAICFLQLLVITGIIPTSLMSGLTAIPHIQAQQDDESAATQEQLRVERLTCSFIAKMANESAAKCYQP